MPQPVAPMPQPVAPMPQPIAPAPQPVAPMGLSGLPSVDVELGAHSQSNFYKGLAGNDVVDHGGLFVSTYQLPPIGTRLALRVSMPGGYEFEVLATVRWAREFQQGAGAAPPGFGAQITQIGQEERQLVYRYVRNREPLFYDDF
jgi:hypothetical protein